MMENEMGYGPYQTMLKFWKNEFLWLLHFYFLNSLDGTGHNFWHIRIPTMFYTILESWDIGQNENHIFRSKFKPKKIAESHDDAPLWN